MKFLNKESLTKLADYIHNEAYKKFVDKKTTVFLCGAARDNKDSTRAKLEEALLMTLYYRYKYQLAYPEDLFTDLLLGHGRHDLISLENILADSVDAIVIIVESWGAVAELGMFSSNDKLRKKIVCIIDKKYKKSKSFIKLGPVRLMKDKKEGVVLYEDFEDFKGIEPPIKKIHQAINTVSKESEKVSGVINALQAHVFVLMCIFLLEPVKKEMIIDLVKYSVKIKHDIAEVLSSTALSMLISKREIKLEPDGYRLTKFGLNEFKSISRIGKKKYAFDINTMDEIRIKILNWKLRNKPLDFS
ncbi:MAG: retron St85 family effector protein [Chloroflexota bacterium]|nr:retron St85 family effector protein [Chloroflexota bacterium]